MELDNILQWIGEALAERYGHRDTPGWMYLLGAVILVGSVYSAKELARKRKALRASKQQQLNSQVLSAALFSEEGGDDVQYAATLRRASGNYRLKITVKKSNVEHVVTDITTATLEDMSDYLEKHTKFILADFR